MLTHVLDASAIMRFLDGEAGAPEVKQILQSADDGASRAIISAVNWGEIVHNLIKRHGLAIANQIERRLNHHALQIIPASATRAAHAGLIKFNYKISYADSFGVELAFDSPDHILVTADYGVKPAERDIRIEFLPTKPKP